MFGCALIEYGLPALDKELGGIFINPEDFVNVSQAIAGCTCQELIELNFRPMCSPDPSTGFSDQAD